MQGVVTSTAHLLITILLPLLCIVGVLGNFLICMAIWLDRRLHNVTNYFLFSLALADLFVCTIVMPISFFVEVHQGKWKSGFELCLLYVYSDVFLCTASIVHMSVISLDRYLGISKPLETRNRSTTMTTLKIMFVWLITVLISCPIAIAALLDPTNILSETQCVITNQYYMIYGSTFAFLIPFIIMAVTYFKTTNLLYKQASLLSQTAIQRAKGEGLRRTLPRRPATSNFLAEMNHKSSAASEFRSMPARLSVPTNKYEDELRLLSVNGDESGQNRENKLRKLCVRTSSVFLSITSKFGSQNTQKAEEIANEHKATRVLAVVFGCFFVCWTPFFAANLANGFFGDKCNIPPTISSLFLWLGYISSIINPLIYTAFNRTNMEKPNQRDAYGNEPEVSSAVNGVKSGRDLWNNMRKADEYLISFSEEQCVNDRQSNLKDSPGIEEQCSSTDTPTQRTSVYILQADSVSESHTKKGMAAKTINRKFQSASDLYTVTTSTSAQIKFTQMGKILAASSDQETFV